MTLPDLGEADKRLRTIRVQVQDHFKRLPSKQVMHFKRHRYSAGVLLIISGVVLSLGLNFSQSARAQQLRAIESVVTPVQAAEAAEIQPIATPAAVISEVVVEKVEPTPTPVAAVAGVSISRIEGTKQDWMSAAGIPQSVWACVDGLVTRESGWRVNAKNAHSSAYGIPQALPGSKMASAGADWATNPVTQLRWMTGYVQARYGGYCQALSFQKSHGWY